MKGIIFDEESKGQKYEVIDFEKVGELKQFKDSPRDWEEFKARVTTYRQGLIEAAADCDDAVGEKFLEDRIDEITEEDIQRALRKGTISFKVVPVLAGSAFKNKGIQMLLDAVITYLPSPVDIPPVKGKHPDTGEEITREARDDQPFSALAFKLMNDKFVGNLTFFRTYSGMLESGSAVLNSTRRKNERIGRLLLMHSNEREDIKEVFAGVIAAAVGLRDTRTGDTLCDERSPIVLESMTFPEPVIEISVEPKTKADQEKMGMALQRLAYEDPSLRVATDEESGQTILKGMGELHLDIVIDRMKREFKVEANTGKPKVAYRETIRKTVEQDYKYVKQTGGRGQYGHVTIEVSPGERGSGYVFVDDIKGGVIPKEYIPAVNKGIEGALSRGVLAGYPVTDVKVRLFFGSYHEVDSSTAAFEIAGSIAFQEAAKKAGLILLEPIMAVEVVTPEQFMGEVIGDLNSRRGQIRGMHQRGKTQVIEAYVPLANMFGYVTDLRSKTQGRAVSTMQFAHYEPVPAAVQEEIVAKVKGG
jgi:elongation factor G